MPQHATDAAGKKTQGGTVVDGASNRVTWIAAGLLLVIVVMVVNAGRGDKEENTSSLPKASPGGNVATAPPPVTPTTTTTTDDDDTVGFTGLDTEVEAGDSKTLNLELMEKQLGERRYWSRVTADPATSTIVTVSSSSCIDPGMKDTLTKTAPQLKSLGFVTLRCVAKHGALVFELTL
jgi:hypothetical protein